MEKSKIQNEVIKLGKLLVKQLNLEDSVDTLGRWMAHYIAEKIIEAQNSVGDAKEKIETECYHVILELWKHRWEVQREHRPLKNFEDLLDLLRKINPENFEPYFYRFSEEKLDAREDPSLAAAFEIDQAARVCLKYMLKKAAASVQTEDTNAILEAASLISPDPDLSVIQMLVANNDYNFDPEDFKLGDDFERDFSKGSVENQIEYLDKLMKHATKIKSELKKELKSSRK